jgi:DNA polymerase/3'-5' exonuclease PolX
MENPEVAQVFDEVADLLDIQGENPFRVRAYRNAARTVRDLSEPLVERVRDSERKLEDLSGIGKDLAGKIKTILETGDLPLRQELRAQVPAGLRDLVHVPGMGPKRALTLYQKLQSSRTRSRRQSCSTSINGSKPLRITYFPGSESMHRLDGKVDQLAEAAARHSPATKENVQQIIDRRKSGLSQTH